VAVSLVERALSTKRRLQPRRSRSIVTVEFPIISGQPNSAGPRSNIDAHAAENCVNSPRCAPSVSVHDEQPVRSASGIKE
jgi:hypothetical protein